MTEQAPDDPDRLPTQAELDAQDLAQMARTSRDKDQANLYPAPPSDPGPPPRVLTVGARVSFWGAATAGVVCLIYGIVWFNSISDALHHRMSSDAAAAPKGQPNAQQIDSSSVILPAVGLVILALFVVAQYVTLVAIASHHSRSARSFFLALVVLNLMCIPVGLDLFYDYPTLWSGAVICGWLQFGLLVLTAILTLRRPVGRWLPESTRIRPTRMLRSR